MLISEVPQFTPTTANATNSGIELGLLFCLVRSSCRVVVKHSTNVNWSCYSLCFQRALLDSSCFAECGLGDAWCCGAKDGKGSHRITGEVSQPWLIVPCSNHQIRVSFLWNPYVFQNYYLIHMRFCIKLKRRWAYNSWNQSSKRKAQEKWKVKQIKSETKVIFIAVQRETQLHDGPRACN